MANQLKRILHPGYDLAILTPWSLNVDISYRGHLIPCGLGVRKSKRVTNVRIESLLSSLVFNR